MQEKAAEVQRASVISLKMGVAELGNLEPPVVKRFWSQYLASYTLSILMFLVGLGNGWSSPYLAKLANDEYTDGIPKANDEELSWVASLSNIGRILGAVLGAVAQDTVGRKLSLYYAGVPMLVSWVCVAVATSVQWLYVYRFISGISMGMIWTTMSHFLAEIADPEIRGSLVLWNIAATSIGLFVGNFMGPYISMKLFAYISLLFCVLFLALFPLIPDSPYRHIMNGSLDKAEKSLQWLRRRQDVKQEMQELQEYINDSDVSFKQKLKELKQPRYLKNFLLMSLINVFLYFSAYNVTNNYMEIILRSSQAKVSTSTIVTVISFFCIVSGLMATLMVDRFGRRFLLISSSLGMALSLTCLGIHFKLLELGFDPVSLSWLPCTCLLIYSVSYNGGVGCIPSALVGELFSPSLKSIASLCFSGLAAVFSSLSTATFLPTLALFGPSYLYWFYAAGVYVSIIYYYTCLPETKGKSLKDIQDDKK